MLLEVKDLTVEFNSQRRKVRAIDRVSFNLESNKLYGLVGESGCGKTTLVKTLLAFLKPLTGQVLLSGRDIFSDNKFLCQNIRVVFQNPYSSFDPRQKILSSLSQGVWGLGLTKSEILQRVELALADVELDRTLLLRYPHQVSGGQLQRLAIARAIICMPKLLILDEAVSSLDLINALKIVELIKRLQKEKSLSVLFVSHNLKLVAKLCQECFVMENGCFVEMGSSSQVYRTPQSQAAKRLQEAARYKLFDLGLR